MISQSVIVRYHIDDTASTNTLKLACLLLKQYDSSMTPSLSPTFAFWNNSEGCQER